jgi:hypothetical protein
VSGLYLLARLQKRWSFRALDNENYPDFVRSSYDHEVAILALDNSNGWSSNNPLGIKADRPLVEDLPDGDYKVAITTVGNFGMVMSRHDEPKIEALKEFVRNGGYL